jgi:putative serine protease PepD
VKRTLIGSAVVALPLMAVMVAGCAGAVGHGAAPKVERIATPKVAQTTLSSGLLALQADYVELFKEVGPSVVQISTSQDLGSGIIFNSQGDIVTNNHVADGFKTFTVTLSNGKNYTGTLVNNFPGDDLAVIHIAASGLHPATFADSSQLQVGDIVMAIGNPLGFQSSATTGIVSAVGRTVSEPNGVTLPNVIQTSAPINPGNSGGALVDLEGQVVGIPTLAALDPQLGSSQAAGIGFAIPSNVVSDIAGQIVKYGKVENSGRAYIGIDVEQRTDSSGNPDGVLVVQITRAAVSAAGLKVHDVITSINGTPTPSVQDLTDALANMNPGQKVKLGVTETNGAKTTISIVLASLPASAS